MGCQAFAGYDIVMATGAQLAFVGFQQAGKSTRVRVVAIDTVVGLHRGMGMSRTAGCNLIVVTIAADG